MKRRILALTITAIMTFTLIITPALATYEDPYTDWVNPPMVDGPYGEPVPEPTIPMPNFGATEQEVTPVYTRSMLSLDALRAIMQVGSQVTANPATFEGTTVIVTPDIVYPGELQAAQAALHQLVSNGTIADGAALHGAFWFYSAEDEDGNEVVVDGEITITFNVPGVQYGGSYHAVYFNSSTGTWYHLPVTVNANGVVTVTLPNIGSLLGIIRIFAADYPPPYVPTVLGEVSAPATGQ